MTFEEGHKHSVGNKGGGRPPLVIEKKRYEFIDRALFGGMTRDEIDEVIAGEAEELEGRIPLIYVMLQKALDGNEKMLSKLLDKIVPTCHKNLIGEDPDNEFKSIFGALKAIKNDTRAGSNDEDSKETDTVL